MYKVSTYFTSLFVKLRISDPALRKTTVQLFSGLVDAVFKNTVDGQRISVLKFVSLTIKDVVNYLQVIRDTGQDFDPRTLRALRSLINLNKNLIVDIGLHSRNRVADQILNTAFLSEIACDIGECVRKFKDSRSLRARIDIMQRLKTLIADYNTVQHTNLNVRGVLEGKTSYDEKELQ